MTKLLLATHNKNKLTEFKDLLQGLPYEVILPADADPGLENFETEEPAQTLEGNAIIKAMVWGNKTGLLTLAEDSGLVVDALDGRPGVHSARYAPGTDTDRNNKLLSEMEGVPEDKRNARFVGVIAIYDPDTGKIRTCEGVQEGVIASETSGDNGFGYDPVFFDSMLGKTNAQMTPEEKNSVSHRGKVLMKARKIIEKEFMYGF